MRLSPRPPWAGTRWMTHRRAHTPCRYELVPISLVSDVCQLSHRPRWEATVRAPGSPPLGQGTVQPWDAPSGRTRPPSTDTGPQRFRGWERLRPGLGLGGVRRTKIHTQECPTKSQSLSPEPPTPLPLHTPWDSYGCVACALGVLYATKSHHPCIPVAGRRRHTALVRSKRSKHPRCPGPYLIRDMERLYSWMC